MGLMAWPVRHSRKSALGCFALLSSCTDPSSFATHHSPRTGHFKTRRTRFASCQSSQAGAMSEFAPKPSLASMPPELMG